MEQLLQIAKINPDKLRLFLLKVVSEELSGLSEPCYYPKLKKHYFTMLHLCDLSDKDIKEFTKRFYKGATAYLIKIHDDPITSLIIFTAYYFFKSNDTVGYSASMIYLSVRTYANLLHKQLMFCNPEAFKYALENLAKTHLFSREKTIPNAIYFISKEITKKYTIGISKADPNDIANMITELRTRISQSLKSFAEIYYKAQEEKTFIKKPHEIEDETGIKWEEAATDKYERIVDNAIKKICVYKYVDKKAILDAKEITKINISLATLLANSMVDIKNMENLRVIYKLFLKEILNVRMLCGKDYFAFIRDLMSIKRTKAVIYLKQQVGELTEKIIKDIKYKDKYDKLSSQSQFMINLYIAFYSTMVLRNTIC